MVRYEQECQVKVMSGHLLSMWAPKRGTLKQADVHHCPQISLLFSRLLPPSHVVSKEPCCQPSSWDNPQKKTVLTQSRTPCDKGGTCCSLGQRTTGRRRNRWQSWRSAGTVYGPLCLKARPRRRLRTSSPNIQCYLETGTETRRKSKTTQKQHTELANFFISIKRSVNIPNLIIATALCTVSAMMRTSLLRFRLLFWAILTPEGNTWLFSC